jgi:hypothetical protein
MAVAVHEAADPFSGHRIAQRGRRALLSEQPFDVEAIETAMTTGRP